MYGMFGFLDISKNRILFSEELYLNQVLKHFRRRRFEVVANYFMRFQKINGIGTGYISRWDSKKIIFSYSSSKSILPKRIFKITKLVIVAKKLRQTPTQPENLLICVCVSNISNRRFLRQKLHLLRKVMKINEHNLLCTFQRPRSFK